MGAEESIRKNEESEKTGEVSRTMSLIFVPLLLWVLGWKKR